MANKYTSIQISTEKTIVLLFQTSYHITVITITECEKKPIWKERKKIFHLFRLKWLNCVRQIVYIYIYYLEQQSIDHELSAVDNSLSQMIEIKLDGVECRAKVYLRWHSQLWTNQITLWYFPHPIHSIPVCILLLSQYGIAALHNLPGKLFHNNRKCLATKIDIVKKCAPRSYLLFVFSVFFHDF